MTQKKPKGRWASKSKAPAESQGTPKYQDPKKKSRPKSKKWGRGRHRQPEKFYDFHEADDRISDIFRHHEFAQFPHEKRHQLTRFYQLLMENQRKDNLTRLLSIRDVTIKHFIDSLIVTRFVDLRFPLLDMGTGPGFPGIPLKIQFPDHPIILAEGVEKRIRFLKQVRESLGLKDLQIIGRFVTPDFVYPVPAIITRAVADVSETLSNISNCLQPEGILYLMKGPNVDEEIRLAETKWKGYFRLEKDVAYSLPATPHQRRLLVYRKIKSTEVLLTENPASLHPTHPPSKGVPF